MKNKIHRASSGFLALTLCSWLSSGLAATPEGQDEVLVFTEAPANPGESIISITSRWRIDDGMTYESTGLTFVNGVDEPKPDDAVRVAHKIVVALSDAMLKQYPSWRGTIIEQLKGPDGKPLPQVSIRNRAGFSLLYLTIRDYTRQKVTFRMEPSFSAKGVKVGIDLVPAETVAGSLFAQAKKNTAETKAAGGGIEVTLGDQSPIRIETANLPPSQIESKLAQGLSGAQARVTNTPVVPDTTDGDARNVHPFDGSEVLLPALGTNSLAINLQDASLGVITKFNFPDTNQGTPYAAFGGWALVAIVVGLLGYLAYDGWRKKQQSEAS